MNSYKLLPTLALATLLGACAMGVSRQEPATVLGKPCPPVKAYTKDEQAQAAKELAAIPPPCVLCGFMDDYSLMRSQCR